MVRMLSYCILFELWRNKMYTIVQFSNAYKIQTILMVLNYTIAGQYSMLFSKLPLTQATLSSEFQKLSNCQVNLPLYQLGPALLCLKVPSGTMDTLYSTFGELHFNKRRLVICFKATLLSHKYIL